MKRRTAMMMDEMCMDMSMCMMRCAPEYRMLSKI